MYLRIVGVTLVLLALALPVIGAQSFLGSYSGNILTPDATVAPPGTWELSYHQFIDVLGGEDLSSFGVLYGAADKLEVGVSFLNDGQSDAVFSGKYQVVSETADMPAVLVGVFDLGGTADWLSNDASFYLAVSKNITAFASDVADQPSRPLRLTAGFGSGVFDGLFAGFDWTLQSNLSLMAEFVDVGFDNDSQVNAGLRFAASDNIRLDLATIDFQDLAFGATFTTRF